jgi:hypothetical protein
VLSENVPVAVNWWFVPAAMPGFVGVTAMDTSVADVTFSEIDPQTAPYVALISVLPMPLPITVIRPGALIAAAVILSGLIVATFVSVETHVAEVVRSAVVLSAYVPTAVNCRLVPDAIIEVVGVIEMDTSCACLLLMELGILLTPHPIRFIKNNDTKRTEYIFFLDIEINLPFSK